MKPRFFSGTPGACNGGHGRACVLVAHGRSGRPMRRGAKTLAVTLALAASCTLAACSGSPQAAGTSSVAHDVTLTATQRKSIHVLALKPAVYHTTVTTTGVVDFDHNRAATVLAPFSGAVTRVLVSPGDKVHKGQPLARVHSPDFAAAVGAYRKAVLAAKAADGVAASDRDLYAQQAISKRENATAQAAAAGADADRAAALQQLIALHMSDKTIAAIRDGKSVPDGEGVIRASIAGTVVARSIAPGQTLAAGSTPCFSIADTAKVWVMARVFGADMGKVRSGDTARVDPDDGSDAMAGKVTNVAAVVDPATRSVKARIELANPHGRLKKGMYVSVAIASHTSYQGLLVPDSAVLRDAEDLPFVYVVTKNGSYARRPVQLGARVGKRYVISKGLDAADKVVTSGSIFLHFIQTQ